MSRRLSRFREFLNKPQHIRATKGGARDPPIGPRGEVYEVDEALNEVRRIEEPETLPLDKCPT